MKAEKVWFGFGPDTGVRAAGRLLRLATRADRAGLDMVAVSDHPYYGQRLDAYAALGMILGATSQISAVATVTNLPARPAPVLARTLSSLAALSEQRIILGIGAGGYWDDIVRLGVERLTPGQAVRAFEEAITLVRALCGGGPPVTFEGEFYRVHGLDPAAVPAPTIWTGSVGTTSLEVTGRLADGWIPGMASDWLSPLYRRSRPVIDEAAAEAGRDPARIATVFNFPGVITPAPSRTTRGPDGRWIGGSVEQWVEELTGAVLEHGASGFVFFPAAADGTELALDRWSQEIVPAVRENIVKA